MWDDGTQSLDPAMLEYRNYSLGVHASLLPQPVFRSGDPLHNMGLAASVPERDRHSTDSKLYTSADMLQAMVLDDEPAETSWAHVSLPGTQAEYDHVDVSMGQQGAVSGAWVESAATRGETTVSPKLLRLRPTPTPSSSTESIRTGFLAGTPEAERVFLCPESATLGSSQPTRQAGTPSGIAPGPRKLLPATSQSRMSKRRPMALTEYPSPAARLLSKLETMPRLAPAPRRSPPPPPVSFRSPSAHPSEVSTPASTDDMSAAEDRVELLDRIAKDEFLVKSKRAGMTYKEIRRKGGYTEAESTLRGRYRTLTKSPEARVRKPEWSEKDVSRFCVTVSCSHSMINPNPTPSKQ